ncbi:MAG: hypothetical protein OEY41_01640 [Acidimicrobiia bacterium]|nr:hypothetical protein [Acidimicrobiia bacterium]
MIFVADLGGRLALIASGARSRAHLHRLYGLPLGVLRGHGLGRHTQPPSDETAAADEAYASLSSIRRQPRTVAPASWLGSGGSPRAVPGCELSGAGRLAVELAGDTPPPQEPS